MIISHGAKFAFFHNPKTAGTSVRQTLMGTEGHNVVFAGAGYIDGKKFNIQHLGIDEFAELYPGLWREVKDYEIWSTYRPIVPRFFSSLGEYTKYPPRVKLNELSLKERNAFLFNTIEKLAQHGTAENIPEGIGFTHFKPQWIYTSSRHRSDIKTWPVSRLHDFESYVSNYIQKPVKFEYRNQGHLLLPSFAQPFRKLIPADTRKFIKEKLRSRHLVTSYSITRSQAEEITGFIRSFYAKDLSIWPQEINLDDRPDLKIGNAA